MYENRDDSPTPDLLYGAKAIARYLGITPEIVYARARVGTFPVFRVGGKVCARRQALAAYFLALEQRATQHRS